MIRGNEYRGLLQVGQVVHSILYGGRSGVIVGIEGEQKPETIQDLGGIVMGGSAHIVVVFEDGTKSTVPKAIVRGIQWDIGLQTLVTPPQVKAVKAYAEQARIERERVKVEEVQRKEQEKADLPGEYPFLTPLSETPGKSTWAAGAANLRKHLAREFTTKFRVKSKSYSGGCSIDVYWTDGPATVDKVIKLYEYDRLSDTFPSVFGGAKYVMGSRTISDEAFSLVAVEMGWPEARRDHKFGGFTGCEIDTGEMIQQECWGRSF